MNFKENKKFNIIFLLILLLTLSSFITVTYFLAEHNKYTPVVLPKETYNYQFILYCTIEYQDNLKKDLKENLFFQILSTDNSTTFNSNYPLYLSKVELELWKDYSIIYHGEKLNSLSFEPAKIITDVFNFTLQSTKKIFINSTEVYDFTFILKIAFTDLPITPRIDLLIILLVNLGGVNIVTIIAYPILKNEDIEPIFDNTFYW